MTGMAANTIAVQLAVLIVLADPADRDAAHAALTTAGYRIDEFPLTGASAWRPPERLRLDLEAELAEAKRQLAELGIEWVWEP